MNDWIKTYSHFFGPYEKGPVLLARFAIKATSIDFSISKNNHVQSFAIRLFQKQHDKTLFSSWI